MKMESSALFVFLINICAVLPLSSEYPKVNQLPKEFVITQSNCTDDDLKSISNRSDVKHENGSAIGLLFTDCDITTIPNALFIHINNLYAINISRSGVDEIESYALNGLHNLEILSLSANNLRYVQAWSSHKLERLHTLDLSRNRISAIDLTGLYNYPNLVYLNLANNVIDKFQSGVFQYIANLNILNLSGNSLQRIEAFTLKALLKLEYLYLENNEIEFIDPYAFTTLSHLKVLHLNGNRLKEINSVLFYNQPKLIHLNLSRNLLNEHAIDGNAFHQNGELRTLDLSHNELKGFQNDVFNGLKSLEIFDVSHNKIGYIQSINFKDFGNVKRFDISTNTLTYLMDNQFAYFKSIEEINLSHNAINNIQKFTFTDLSTLRTLDLSFNALSDDVMLMENPSTVTTLDLSYNQFETFNISYVSTVSDVRLLGNPWICTWIISELIVQANNRPHNIHFGKLYVVEVNSTPSVPIENISSPEKIDCYDYNVADKNSVKPILRHIVVFRPAQNCDGYDNDKKRTNLISMYPRTFSKLLSDEFDYKACLLWTFIAVLCVMGLIRLGKHFLEKSERKSENFRLLQQEKVMKDIEEYFAKANTENKSRS